MNDQLLNEADRLLVAQLAGRPANEYERGLLDGLLYRVRQSPIDRQLVENAVAFQEAKS
jgi:hypothetical protein